MLIGSVLALLVAVAAVLYSRRIGRATSVIDDATLRAIEDHGRVEIDEPLDLDLIREEERQFLEEERWDEADEW
ncbi:MAG: hypothetical protein ACREKM_03995 [Longimicrobiales bacterium]